MINLKRALLFLPLYIAAMIAVDIVFKSAHVSPTKPLPVGIVFGFIGAAIVVVAVGIWYFTQRSAGKVSQKREHTYVAIMVGVMVSGFVGDTASGIAGLFMGGKSLWVMAPSYALAYVVLLWTIVFTANVLDSQAATSTTVLVPHVRQEFHTRRRPRVRRTTSSPRKPITARAPLE